MKDGLELVEITVKGEFSPVIFKWSCISKSVLGTRIR